MKKCLIGLTDRQHQYLKKISEQRGMGVAELVRRILDEHIDDKMDKLRATYPEIEQDVLMRKLMLI